MLILAADGAASWGGRRVGSKLTNNTLFLQGRARLLFAFSTPVVGSLLAFPLLMS